MSNAWCLSQSNGSPTAGATDAQACILGCRQEFLQALAPTNGAILSICEALSGQSKQIVSESIRSLYCCDSRACGVDILNNKDQDPNVQWITSSCQSIGYHDIVIPAPPNTKTGCECASSSPSHTTAAIRLPSATLDPTSTHSSEPSQTLTGDMQGPSLTDASLFGLPSHSTTQTPSTTVFLSTSAPSSTITDANSGYTETQHSASHKPSLTVAVTAALCSFAGVALIVALAVWYLRRRRSRTHSTIHSRSQSQDDLPVPGSPTPLVSRIGSPTSPEDSILIPPRRLRERKLLVMKASRSHARQMQEHEWLEHPGLYNHSSPAGSTERILPCQIPFVSKEAGDRSLSKRTTFGHELPPKEPQAPNKERQTLATSNAASSQVEKSSASDAERVAITHAGPRRFHLPSQVSGFVRPGPPPEKKLPATPSDVYQGLSTMPMRRYGGPGPGSGDATRFTRQSGPTVDLGRSFGSMREHLIRPPPIRLEPVQEDAKAFPSSPGSPVIGEGELERLGGSYK